MSWKLGEVTQDEGSALPLLVKDVINVVVKGKLLQAGLWVLLCHLGSWQREVLVTLRKNGLELCEANRPCAGGSLPAALLAHSRAQVLRFCSHGQMPALGSKLPSLALAARPQLFMAESPPGRE